MGILDLPDEILIQILLYNNHDALLDLEGVGDRSVPPLQVVQCRWASLLCITPPKRYYHLPFF